MYSWTKATTYLPLWGRNSSPCIIMQAIVIRGRLKDFQIKTTRISDLNMDLVSSDNNVKQLCAYSGSYKSDHFIWNLLNSPSGLQLIKNSGFNPLLHNNAFWRLWNTTYLKILWKMALLFSLYFQKYSKLYLNFSWFSSMLSKKKKMMAWSKNSLRSKGLTIIFSDKLEPTLSFLEGLELLMPRAHWLCLVALTLTHTCSYRLWVRQQQTISTREQRQLLPVEPPWSVIIIGPEKPTLWK